MNDEDEEGPGSENDDELIIDDVVVDETRAIINPSNSKHKPVIQQDNDNVSPIVKETDDLPSGAPRPVSLEPSRHSQFKSQSQQSKSFVTAKETLSQQSQEEPVSSNDNSLHPSPIIDASSQRTGSAASVPEFPSQSNSQASLLRRRSKGKDVASNTESDVGKPSSTRTKQPKTASGDEGESSGFTKPEPSSVAVNGEGTDPIKAKLSAGMVRFNVPEEDAQENNRKRLRIAQISKKRSLRRRQGFHSQGEIIKIEKMLVRVETTTNEISKDYDENESMKIESKIVEKWREFVVVCRESSQNENELCLQFYKSRVIPALREENVKKKHSHEIPLSHKTTKINMYSSLDKSIVLWLPAKRGNQIYIMCARSAANSVEWLTFLRTALGWDRPKTLQIHVPDLNLNLQLDKPFEKLEAIRDKAVSSEEGFDGVILQTMIEEQAVSKNIIRRCMKMLEGNPEWSDMLETWSKTLKMGLAWRRYDRLEWVHGANEQKMYGNIAMQKSHELELRPKQHYPTGLSSEGEAGTELVEPTPIEGFLIRLTSQRGRDQRMGKMFYKRLYYSTHNQYLCFCRPAKAMPPPPPELPLIEGAKVPTSKEIADSLPLIYNVEPYKLENKEIEWLKKGTNSSHKKRDEVAYREAQRQVNTLLDAEGFVNLCDVTEVKTVVRGNSPVDQHMDQGDQVDFDQEVNDTTREDGVVSEFDDQRTFQLSLVNGLVIRLEAFDKVTKNEWIKRLRSLVQYWKLRVTADTELLKSVRLANLRQLNIDEQTESFLGQFASKWEVSRAMASAELYNMCSITCCRTISVSRISESTICSMLTAFQMSGVLFRKPRRYAAFKRHNVILSHGSLLVFEHSLRKVTGEQLEHIHHDRHSVIDLRDSYIYSGLVTQGDLLYQNENFDANQAHIGSHILPRVYIEDGWTSSDEDTMTCFVIWQGTRKGFFRSEEGKGEVGGKIHVKRVNQLGKPGKAIVFKTRSRAERDHWVMNIGMEIERLQQVEEIRVVS